MSARQEAERLAGEALPCNGIQWESCCGNSHGEKCVAYYRPAVADLLEKLLTERNKMRTALDQIASFDNLRGRDFSKAFAEIARKALPAPPKELK